MQSYIAQHANCGAGSDNVRARKSPNGAVLRHRHLLCRTVSRAISFVFILTSVHVYAEATVYEYTEKYESYLQAQPLETVIWSNRNLSEVKSFRARMKGGWMSSSKDAVGFVCDRTDGGMVVQFQCLDGVRKAVRARFRQDGSDIRAYADMCGYDNGTEIGVRMPDDVFSYEVSTNGTDGVYGVYDVEALSVRETIKEIEENADGIVVNGGILNVNAERPQSLLSAVSGTGGLQFSASTPTQTLENVFAPYLAQTDQLVIEKTLLSDVEVNSGIIGGGWCGVSEILSAYHRNMAADGQSFTVQFQWYNKEKDTLKGVVAQFTQSGENVTAKAIRAMQASNSSAIGTDMMTDTANWPSGTYPIATSDDGDGYGVKCISYRARRVVSVTLSGAKAWTGGTYVCGIPVTVSSSGLAEGSRVEVSGKGVLTVNAGHESDVYPAYDYLVADAKLCFGASFAVNNRDRIEVHNGIVEWNLGQWASYFNSLSLFDACVIGGINGIGVGLDGDAHWTTSGSGMSTVAVEVRLTGGTRTFTLETSEDIRFAERVFEYPDMAYKGMKFRKAGNAKAIFAKGCVTSGNLTFSGGTLVICEDSAFGELILGTEDATIELSAGKNLAFANSSLSDWGSGQLAITAGKGSSISFGADAQGLTRNQLKHIKINGKPVIIDEHGILRSSFGMMVSVR